MVIGVIDNIVKPFFWHFQYPLDESCIINILFYLIHFLLEILIFHIFHHSHLCSKKIWINISHACHLCMLTYLVITHLIIHIPHLFHHFWCHILHCLFIIRHSKIIYINQTRDYLTIIQKYHSKNIKLTLLSALTIYYMILRPGKKFYFTNKKLDFIRKSSLNLINLKDM